MINIEIIHLRKIYKFPVVHFWIRHIVFCLLLKIVIKVNNDGFSLNHARYEKMLKDKNCLPHKDEQILYRPFFDQT